MSFLSTGEDNEKSDLIFHIEEFNQLIEEYNILGVTENTNKSISTKNIARWTTDF